MDCYWCMKWDRASIVKSPDFVTVGIFAVLFMMRRTLYKIQCLYKVFYYLKMRVEWILYLTTFKENYGYLGPQKHREFLDLYLW
jgi:hypothetical protein